MESIAAKWQQTNFEATFNFYQYIAVITDPAFIHKSEIAHKLLSVLFGYFLDSRVRLFQVENYSFEHVANYVVTTFFESPNPIWCEIKRYCRDFNFPALEFARFRSLLHRLMLYPVLYGHLSAAEYNDYIKGEKRAYQAYVRAEPQKAYTKPMPERAITTSIAKAMSAKRVDPVAILAEQLGADPTKFVLDYGKDDSMHDHVIKGAFQAAQAGLVSKKRPRRSELGDLQTFTTDVVGPREKKANTFYGDLLDSRKLVLEGDEAIRLARIMARKSLRCN